jgi:hypothetical protein
MDLKDFVPITGTGNIIYYGGDQSWFSTKVGKQSGCGTVAAANTLAYLAIKNPGLRALYSGNSLDSITKDDYIVHMNQVHQFVEPLKMPFFDQPAGGIPFLSWYSEGVIKYAKSKGISLTAHWNKGTSTFDKAIQYIKEGLSKDCPVALVNWRNSKLKSIPWTNPDTGITSKQDFQLHWVTITGLHDYRPIGQVHIDVSSWGSKVALSFDDVWNNTDILRYVGMVYFDW